MADKKTILIIFAAIIIFVSFGFGREILAGTLNYSWSCEEGNLSDPNIAQPTYTAPQVSANTNYTCTLTVTDTDTGLSDSDSMNVLVKDFAPPAATLSVDLWADPSSGSAPLNNVDLGASVSGRATGDITYRFDCTNNGSWERSYTTSSTTYTAYDLCDYGSSGTYTAKVRVTRGGATAEDTTTITVSSPAATLSVDLWADPSSGSAPLNDVDLGAEVSGTATGDITYRFDCTNNGSWERSYTTSSTTYTAYDLCDYGLSEDTYTAKVRVTRGGATAEDTTTITVSAAPTLSVDLWADPSSGEAPLYEVDLRAEVYGTATGTINYTFWCNCSYTGTNIWTARDRCGGWNYKRDGTWQNPLTAQDICDYPSIGNYTAKVIAERSSLAAEDRTTVSVSRPPNLPPDKPQPGGDGGDGDGGGRGEEETWNHCSVQGLSVPTFYWTYSDPDGDPQTAYEIRIDNDSNFPATPTPDEFTDSGGASTAYTPIPSDWRDWMNWSTDYWWIVRVKDDHGNWSEWSEPNYFRSPNHAHPWPDFSHQPQSPVVGEIVEFIDNSKCYSYPGNVEYDCKESPSNQYQWDFEDDGQIDCDSNLDPDCQGDASYRYQASGDYTVRLFLTDELGTCDGTGDTPITAELPLPEYKEIPPFLWLKNFLAGIGDFFNL